MESPPPDAPTNATPEQVFAGACDPRRPLGLYVHFPFCGARCPYCDFAIDVRPEVPHERYAQAVCDELAARGSAFATDAPLVSIYFGGGTPGLWRASCVRQVIDQAAKLFAVADTTKLEISLEANPGEITQTHLRALREAGVNRVSFGVQAFDDGLLRQIGRTHSKAQSHQAVPWAREAGFHNVACDLMYGLPGQSLDLWRATLDAAIAIAPDHLSCYALTVEPFTPFGQREKKGQLHRPDDDAVAAMWDAAHAKLAAAGYAHYEVSSYARPGARAVHNTLYWTQGAYLGVGCAAASFRPLSTGGGWRFINPRAAETYMRQAESGGGRVPAAQVEWRDPSELESEAVWLALRTTDGIDRRSHREMFGCDPLAPPGREQAAERLKDADWLDVSATHVRPTALGLAFADELATRLWA